MKTVFIQLVGYVLVSCCSLIGCLSAEATPLSVLGAPCPNATYTFAPAMVYDYPEFPDAFYYSNDVNVGDMNSDGTLDVVVGNSGEDTMTYPPASVTVLKQQISGNTSSFSLVGQYPVSDGQSTKKLKIDLGDVDRDGDLDVVAGTFSDVRILFNDGQGHLTQQLVIDISGDQFIADVAFVEVNNDNRLDIVTANFLTGVVGVLLNTSSAPGTSNVSFSSSTDYYVGGSPVSLAVGYFNSDGSPDFAVGLGFADPGVAVLLGSPSGVYTVSNQLPALTGAMSVSIGDINRDGKADIVAAGNFDIISIYKQAPSSGGQQISFLPEQTMEIAGNPNNIALRDLNGDRWPEIVSSLSVSNKVSIIKNNIGTLVPITPKPLGPQPTSILVADINGDGNPDILSSNKGVMSVEESGFTLLKAAPATCARP